MTRIQLDSVGFDLPQGWESSAIVLHSEEGASVEEGFAPTFVISRCVGVAPSESIDDVLAENLRSLEDQLDSFLLREQNRLTVGRSEARTLEYDYTDPEGHRLRQQIALRRVGDALYSITATHLASKDFSRVRQTLLGLLESLGPRT
jgi:hypothetical protein